MSASTRVVLLVSVVLLYGLRPGECQITVSTIPQPGETIGAFNGTQNITITCQLSNQDGSRRATSWLKQTVEDRAAGRGPGPVIAGEDPNIILSGGTINTTFGPFPVASNLTIVSLTEELDKAIIFCGSDYPLANFTLGIYYPPLLMDRGVVEMRENEEFSVDMADPPLAFPFPSLVSWTKDDIMVEIESSSSRVINYSSIFIGSVEPSDSGVYNLSATNYQLKSSVQIGSSSATITLNVLFGARFNGEGSGTVAVVEGESATLVCGTGLTGNPLPTISWTDNNNSLVTEGGRVLLSSDREEVSLTINNTVRGDDGYWNCSAQVFDSKNLTVGQPVTGAVRLVVVAAPDSPVDVSVKESGPTWIDLEWFQFGGRGNPPLSRHVITVQETGSEVEVRNVGGSPVANVTGLQPGVKYIFSVIAVSEFGDIIAESPPSTSITGNTTFSVPAPQCSDRPSDVNDRLVVRWNYTHTGGLPITSVNVYISTTPGSRGQSFSTITSGTVEPVTVLERQDSIPLPLAGLTYLVTVEATNSLGTGIAVCPSLLLMTGKPARPNPPVVDKTSGTSAVITVSTDHSGVRDIAVDMFQFIIRITEVTERDTELTIEKSITSPSCDGVACSGSLTISAGDGGLKKGVLYIVNVTASNRYGVSEVSGNSEPFVLRDDSTTGSPTSSDPGVTESRSSAAGTIAGAVVGSLVIVILIVLIVMLFLFIIFKMRNSTSYKVNGRGSGGGQGVKVEEVDIGKDLNSADPNKELQYAELEHFQNSSSDSPTNKKRQIDGSVGQDEPVQYATLMDINPKAATATATAAATNGGTTQAVENDYSGTVSVEMPVVKEGGGAEGDKAMTSSTFV